jgi:hypothetical protein
MKAQPRVLGRHSSASSSACGGAESPDRTAEALSAELGRLDRILALHLSKLRSRGRSRLGDAVGGAVIEDGEAEGLLASLHETHTRSGTFDEHLEPWESPLTGLERTREVYALLAAERDMLMLALAVELDSRYARLAAYLNDHVQMTRPTLGLATLLLAPDDDAARMTFLERVANSGPLARFGLIELEGDGPVANRAIRVPASFWPRLVGMQSKTWFELSRRENVADFSAFVSRGLKSRIDRLWRWAESRDSVRKLIHVSGELGACRDQVARFVAGGLRPATLVVDARKDDIANSVVEIAREALWHRAAVVVRSAESLDERTHRALQSGVVAPIVYVTRAAANVVAVDPCRRDVMELQLSALDDSERERLWTIETEDVSPDLDTKRLASLFGFEPDCIRSEEPS